MQFRSRREKASRGVGGRQCRRITTTTTTATATATIAAAADSTFTQVGGRGAIRLEDRQLQGSRRHLILVKIFVLTESSGFIYTT